MNLFCRGQHPSLVFNQTRVLATAAPVGCLAKILLDALDPKCVKAVLYTEGGRGLTCVHSVYSGTVS